MSLFVKLLLLISDGKTRSEDFLTEIVAQVLQNCPELTVRWLAELELTTGEKPFEVLVSTQEKLDPLENHRGAGSRPDISIRITRGKFTELIYIESKVGSEEIAGIEDESGQLQIPSQLQRYADHLEANRRTDLSKRSLVFITRDFEPKKPPIAQDVAFRQVRWYDFYRFLKKQPQPTDLINELTLFMEENNMSQNNQFSTIDILALANFQKARKIMDATIWEGDDKESVAKKFERICGGASPQKKGIAQFRDYNRYVTFVWHGQGWQFGVLLGYFMPSEALTGYPEVGMVIQINPKAANRPQIVSAMQDFETYAKKNWKCQGLANEREWGSLSQLKSLKDFLSEEDHIKKIAEYFKGLLDDVNEFRKRYSNLPWKAQEDE